MVLSCGNFSFSSSLPMFEWYWLLPTPLAVWRNKVMEVATPTVSAVTAPLPQLTSEIEQLRAEVSRLLNRQTRACSSSRVRAASAAPQSTSSPSEHTLCWYHQKFGDAAQKCKPYTAKSEVLKVRRFYTRFKKKMA